MRNKMCLTLATLVGGVLLSSQLVAKEECCEGVEATATLPVSVGIQPVAEEFDGTLAKGTETPEEATDPSNEPDDEIVILPISEDDQDGDQADIEATDVAVNDDEMDEDNPVLDEVVALPVVDEDDDSEDAEAFAADLVDDDEIEAVRADFSENDGPVLEDPVVEKTPSELLTEEA